MERTSQVGSAIEGISRFFLRQEPSQNPSEVSKTPRTQSKVDQQDSVTDDVQVVAEQVKVVEEKADKKSPEVLSEHDEPEPQPPLPLDENDWTHPAHKMIVVGGLFLQILSMVFLMTAVYMIDWYVNSRDVTLNSHHQTVFCGRFKFEELRGSMNCEEEYFEDELLRCALKQNIVGDYWNWQSSETFWVEACGWSSLGFNGESVMWT